MRDALALAEDVVDRAAVVDVLEAALGTGARERQLRVRTLLVGLLLAIADDRPAQLTRVHRALLALTGPERDRLGVRVAWPGGPHELTYRQVEYTFARVVGTLAKAEPDGEPSDALRAVLDALLDASIPPRYQGASRSLAVDWSDLETFARPPRRGDAGADREASWGHRNAGVAKEDLFFGYYLSTAVVVHDEGADAVPELTRRALVTSCAIDPVRAFTPSLTALATSGVPLGDVLADAGYAHRRAEHFALPLRRAGASLVIDVHPQDRGPHGTFAGAIASNGNLYCPATPPALLALAPLARHVSSEEIARHDALSAELAHYKFAPLSAEDPDGYRRVVCPAVAATVRCARRVASLDLAYDRPAVGVAPDPAPRCCCQRSVTVPPEVNAKTRQKHDYPSAAHRRSYQRRTAVERSYATIKDPASTDITRGWCRVTGVAAITLLVACALVIRNERIVAAFEERHKHDARELAPGAAPRRRKRRRRTLDSLIAAAN